MLDVNMMQFPAHKQQQSSIPENFVAAGTMRPAFTSRPSEQPAPGSAGATNSIWREPAIVFHGADDPLQHTASSTPAKLGQMVKNTIVKFKEVMQQTDLCSHFVLPDIPAVPKLHSLQGCGACHRSFFET